MICSVGLKFHVVMCLDADMVGHSSCLNFVSLSEAAVRTQEWLRCGAGTSTEMITLPENDGYLSISDCGYLLQFQAGGAQWLFSLEGRVAQLRQGFPGTPATISVQSQERQLHGSTELLHPWEWVLPHWWHGNRGIVCLRVSDD